MQGSMTVADTSVTFVIDDQEHTGSIFIQDGLSGKQHRQDNIPMKTILAALMVLLDGDEGDVSEEMRDLAESIQPQDFELRFIP